MFKELCTSKISLPKILLISNEINCAFLSFSPVITTPFEPAFLSTLANFLISASIGVVFEATGVPDISLYKFNKANTTSEGFATNLLSAFAPVRDMLLST